MIDFLKKNLLSKSASFAFQIGVCNSFISRPRKECQNVSERLFAVLKSEPFTHFSQCYISIAPENIRKPYTFLMFSRGIEI